MTNAELKELVHLLLMCGIMDRTALESGNVTDKEWLRMGSLIGKYQAEKSESGVQGDLISRSALRKQFGYTDEWYKSRTVTQIIDNAQTVEPFEPDYVGAERLKARQRGYEAGYHNGLEIGKTLNPKIKQGGWIKDSLGYNCENCHFHAFYEGDEQVLTNYCPSCGARMKGGAE